MRQQLFHFADRKYLATTPADICVRYLFQNKVGTPIILVRLEYDIRAEWHATFVDKYKSTSHYRTVSLKKFVKKFQNYSADPIVIHTGDYMVKDGMESQIPHIL